MPLPPQRRSSPQTHQTFHLPAPTGGLNTVSAGSAMPLTDCILLYNLISAEYGLRTRLGWTEWCTGITGLTDNLVRCVMPFTGSAKNGSNHRLFCTTSTGIWDVTESTTTPTQVLEFDVQTADAGYGVSHVVVTAAGHFLLYTDEENGLHVYSESSDTWAAVAMGAGGTQIDGVDPADLVFVTVFKNRVCFVERDTARFWYLDAGSIYGAATAFEVGTQFRAGGHLVGLWNWTLDGGSGLDDSLVGVSSGGDVVIYQGTDPDSATTFGLKGVWYAGGLPAGREVATNFGGDMLLLTRVGVLPLSRLISGGEAAGSQYATQKIGNLFNSLMLSRSTLKGWALRLHPEDNALVIQVPTADGIATQQLVMALANRSWSRYRDLPIYSSEVWGGKLYFGTADGRVCINTGYVDGVKLEEEDAYTPVQWAVLSAFTNMGNARQKQVLSIRPTVLSDAMPSSYRAEARYKYNFLEMGPVSLSPGGRGTWDASTWDADVWSGEYQANQVLHGAVGMGVDVAIALRGTAAARTVLVGVDVLFRQGGFL